MLSNRILVCSNDASVVNHLLRIARKSHIYASAVNNIAELTKQIKKKRFLALFIDYRIFKDSSKQYLELKGISNDTFLVVVTTSGKYEDALNSFGNSAFAILKNPTNNNELARIIWQLKYVKHIVKNTTRRMLEMDGADKGSTTDSSSIENMSLETLIKLKLKKVIQKLNLDNLKGFHNIVIEEVEKPLFQIVLEKVNGNQIKAARILGINRNTLSKKLKQYNIKK